MSKLYLSTTNLGDKGLCSLIQNINCVCYLKELHLKCNYIHATGVSCLADAVCSGMIVFRGSVSTLDLSYNPLGIEGTLALGKMLSINHCQLSKLVLFQCALATAGGSLPLIDSQTISDNISVETVRDVGKQLCQMPQSNTITWLDFYGNSFAGEGIYILAGFMHLCSCLEHLYSCNCGITSDDLERLLEKLSQLKSLSPSLCSKLESWYLNNNEIDDSGVSVLMNHLPLLFPRLRCGRFDGIDLSNNPVSIEMERILKGELRRRKEVRSKLAILDNG